MLTPDNCLDTKSYAVNPDSYRDGQPRELIIGANLRKEFRWPVNCMLKPICNTFI